MYENELKVMRLKLGLSDNASLDEISTALENRFNVRAQELERRRNRDTSFRADLLEQAEAAFRDVNEDIENLKKMRSEIEKAEQEKESEERVSREYPAGDGEFATKRYLKLISDEMNLNLTDEEIDKLYKEEQITKDGKTYKMEKRHEAQGYDDYAMDEFVIRESKAKEQVEEEPEPTPEPPQNTTPTPDPIPDPPKGTGGIDDPIPDPPRTEKSNLPVVSGLQIYNRVLQEVGPIRGTKTLKAEYVLSHLPLVGRLLGTPLRLLTGRKKEIRRISETIEDIDFKKEYGLSRDQAIDLMLDDCLLDGPLGKDGRGITKLKVNDIFLKGLTANLNSNVKRRIQVPQQEIENYVEEIKKLQESRPDATQAQQQAIDLRIGILNQNINEKKQMIEKITDQPREVDDARINKSYDKKDNIKGKDAAVRDPDNREEVNKLAGIDKKRLEAVRDNDASMALQYQRQMDEYMDSKTWYSKELIGNGIVSRGAFEAKIATPNIVSKKDYVFVKVASGVGLALTTAAISVARMFDRMSEQLDLSQQINDLQAQQSAYNRALHAKQKMINRQTAAHNKLAGEVKNAQGQISYKDADSAVASVYKQPGELLNVTERGSEFKGGFYEQNPAYIQSDKAGINQFNASVKNAEQYYNSNYGMRTQNPGQMTIDALEFNKKSMIANRKAYVDNANAAKAFYQNGNANIMSKGGVLHDSAANYEMYEQIAAQDSAIATQDAVIRALKSMYSINPSQVQNIKLDPLNIDFGALQQVVAEAGLKPDLFPIIAQLGLGAANAQSINSKNKEAKSYGGPDHMEK